MYELGILDEFLKRPRQEGRELAGQVGTDGDNRRLHSAANALQVSCVHAAAGFAELHADQGKRNPRFNVRMQADVTDLIEDSRRIVKAKTPRDATEIRAGVW